MHARSKLIESSDISFYSQSTAEVARRALRERAAKTQMVRGKMTPSARPCKPRSNEAMFMVFPVR
jgi:hypothetical protein